MKKQLIPLLIALCLLPASAPAETVWDAPVLLRLSFDEGRGAAVRDESGHLQDAEVQYQYLNPVYTEKMDPQWRSLGVEGGSLLFDGSSTCVA